MNKVNENQKPSEPVDEERWAMEEVDMMKNPLAIQVVALCIQILALIIILLKIR